MRSLVLVLALSAMPLAAAAGQGSVPPPAAPAAIAAAREWGELYDVILADAWAGDSLAVGALFGYEEQEAFQGAAAEEHRRVLYAVLVHLGDDQFARVLTGEVPRVRGVIVRVLEAADPEPLGRRFPRTAGVAAGPAHGHVASDSVKGP